MLINSATTPACKLHAIRAPGARNQEQQEEQEQQERQERQEQQDRQELDLAFYLFTYLWAEM